MSRTFFVKFNIDTFRDYMAILDGMPDSAYRDWMRGFNRGVGGACPTNEEGALLMGMSMGYEAFDAANKFRAAASEAGRKSADVRRATTGTAQPERPSNDLRTTFERNPERDTELARSQYLESNNEKLEPINEQSETHPQSAPAQDGFDEFWEAYGKKRGKPKCIALWKGLSLKDREAAMAALPAYVSATPDPQFRKDPERYLRHRAWEDELPTPKVQPQLICPFPDGSPKAWDWWALHGDYS